VIVATDTRLISFHATSILWSCISIKRYVYKCFINQILDMKSQKWRTTMEIKPNVTFHMHSKVLILNLSQSTVWRVGRDRVTFGIANRYSLDGPGMESRLGGEIFRTRPDRPWDPSYTRGTGSFPGVKRPDSDVDHPPPSNTEVKQRVALVFYSPLGLCGLFSSKIFLFFFVHEWKVRRQVAKRDKIENVTLVRTDWWVKW
jgi:hypothetical protein